MTAIIGLLADILAIKKDRPRACNRVIAAELSGRYMRMVTPNMVEIALREHRKADRAEAKEIASAASENGDPTLTRQQVKDIHTLVTLGGYSHADAVATVTRPKVKVYAPTSVPQAHDRASSLKLAGVSKQHPGAF